MDIKIQGHNIRIGEQLEEYTQEKLMRLERYLPNIAAVNVELTRQQAHSGDVSIVQITLRHKRGAILRVEERMRGDGRETMLAAINDAVDKMYRQIERFKGKRDPKPKRGRFTATAEEIEMAEEAPVEAVTAAAADPYADVDGIVVRRKEVTLSPMTEDEAIAQMELLGHPFFMFFNADTRSVGVLYRRDAGGYGMLVPRLEA